MFGCLQFEYFSATKSKATLYVCKYIRIYVPICMPHSNIVRSWNLIMYSAICMGDLSFYLSLLSWKRAAFGRGRNAGNTVLQNSGSWRCHWRWVQKDETVAKSPSVSTIVAPGMCGCCRPFDLYPAVFLWFSWFWKANQVLFAWTFLPMLNFLHPKACLLPSINTKSQMRSSAAR